MNRIIFDGKCPLCKVLAHYAQKRVGESLEFVSLEEYCMAFGEQSPALCSENQGIQSTLIVETEGSLAYGRDAWQWLLLHHPSLKELHWLAQKLGLVEWTARRLEKTGHALRWFCSTCPQLRSYK